jgi:membrane protease YdiL (CAAX protease family)
MPSPIAPPTSTRTVAAALEGAAWRAFLLTAGLVLATWIVHNAFLLPWEETHLTAAQREPGRLALRILVWCLPAAAYLSRHDPRPIGVAWGLTSPVDFPRLLWQAPVAIGYLTLAALLARASAPDSAAEPSFASLVRVVATVDGLWLFVGVALEELLMRGFLLRQLLRRWSAGPAVLVVALLFAAMHLPAWIAMGGLSVGVAVSFVVLFVMGLVLGALTWTSGSLWPAIVVHVINNVLAGWLAAG